MNRRGFLSSILALGAAPAIVRAASLMPARGIVIPTTAEVMAVAEPEFVAFHGANHFGELVRKINQIQAMLIDKGLMVG